MASFWTKDLSGVPCITRQILNYWVTREPLEFLTDNWFFISGPWIYHPAVSWSLSFLMRNQLLILLRFLCTWWIDSFLLISRLSLFLAFNNWQKYVWVHLKFLLEGCWVYWICMSIYFLKLRGFTAIITSDILPIPCSILSFCDSHGVHVDLLVVGVSEDHLTQLTCLHSCFLSGPMLNLSWLFLN